MAKLHSNISDLLAALAPAIGEIIGGLANREYVSDRIYPRVNIRPGAKRLTGNLIRWRADAMFGDPNLDDSVPEGQDPVEYGAGSIAALPFTGQRRMLNSLHDELAFGDILDMPEVDQLRQLEQLCSAAVQAMRIARERRCALLHQTPGNFATTAAAALAWNNPLADIVGELDALVRAPRAFGGRATAMVIPEATAARMRVAPQILQQMSMTADRNRMSDETLIAWLKGQYGLQVVIIADAIRNTSAVDGTLTPAGVWAAGTIWAGDIPTQGDSAGPIGVPVRVGESMLTPSATALVPLQDWRADYIKHPTSPKEGYQLSYIEAEMVFCRELGATITGC